MLEARRGPRGLHGHVVLYGHYDTVAANPKHWRSEPNRVSEHDGRWFARGIADNKGPLAARLWALETIEHTPAITWIVQGEEETGSVWSREVLAQIVPGIVADLWLDETGYHDYESGTLRLLARRIGAQPDTSDAPDDVLVSMLDGLRILAANAGVATRTEVRGLNKTVVAGGCPFNHALPPGARYLALGVNDSHARIHASNESIPTNLFELHRDQLALLFEAVGGLAGA
ncbi:MAG: M20/M25/M40 family metallo-hydrolase [Nannocystaceae bacterium]